MNDLTADEQKKFITGKSIIWFIIALVCMAMHTRAIMNQIIDFPVINFFCSSAVKSFIFRLTPPKIVLRLCSIN